MHEGRSFYFLEEGEVYIVYTNDKDPKWIDCGNKLPSGTVVMIMFKPKKEMTLRDMNFNEKRFKKFDPSVSEEIDFEGYLNKKDGILIRTYKSKVDQICYIAAAKDKHLCAGYYDEPEKFLSFY